MEKKEEQVQQVEVYKPKHHVRVVTASSLFDGHDAAINIMRRILQASGAEVIHLGHNRSVEEVVNAAIQEDVQAIAVSSYQGGHMEYFKYMIDLLKERGAEHIKVFGGGGGVIIPREIKELHDYGVAWIFSPEDGRRLGLQGMINEILKMSDFDPPRNIEKDKQKLREGDHQAIARLITYVEKQDDDPAKQALLEELHKNSNPNLPVLGITGTGGAGKSSLTDELVLRFLHHFPDKKIAIISVDPTKRKTGGALLGDRIRMNAINNKRVYMRSMATRDSKTELSNATKAVLDVVRAADFDLIIVETSGIGQGDAEITEITDLTMYVMTAEYGAPSQLEKIDMIDFADFIAINKFEQRGALDALKQVRKQYERSRGLFGKDPETFPVFGTSASRFNDPGVNRLFKAIIDKINEDGHWGEPEKLKSVVEVKEQHQAIIPPDRINYLREISETVRNYHKKVEEQSEIARKLYQLHGARNVLKDKEAVKAIEELIEIYEKKLDPETKEKLEKWDEMKEKYESDTFTYKVRDKEFTVELKSESLAGTKIPKVAFPKYEDWGDRVKWLMRENVPGEFPYTAGVFPFKRKGEDPTRMFAGEGTPERTNKRFHYLSKDQPAKRLSTAFDSVTLYGEDPDYRPDIYGKIGESGVSVCTLDDMKKLYKGFDLTAPNTSVSMTINGPAPIMLAFFFNTAIDQQVEKFKEREGREPTKEEYEQIKKETLQVVRGTVQADILKEDQGQNTCIFSTEFALRMMGDIQQYFIDNNVRNYYSVSISGYHIAEAGANPITQLAFTLANGFTYVEYYLSRGMHIDDFAPNLSFFFSNGLDPEYTVIGRVARRIWAIVMREKYGASERSQKLKYHIQTSGRSLHAQEMDFNDIRTTLQALLALQDNTNSLHTNAYDEAVTTPTEESVRRAMAIQLIINKEFGLMKNENPLQGSFIIEELTDLVEEAVLKEFERLNDRGGVLGAMERQYQRSKIQEESLYYESLKHSGELPIIGVNTFLNPNPNVEEEIDNMELARATKEEKELQIKNLNEFKERNKDKVDEALRRLQDVARSNGNIFEELMETVKVASLGQITRALYEVGGEYRRNM